MSTLQQALRDAGLSDAPDATPVAYNVRTRRPAHTAPPDAPASSMGRVQRESRYGGRLRTHTYTPEINLPQHARLPELPSIALETYREAMAIAHARAAEELVGVPEYVLAMLPTPKGACASCFMVLPRGHTSCPDC